MPGPLGGMMRRFAQVTGTQLARIILGTALGCTSESTDAIAPRFPEDQPFSCGAAETPRFKELMQPYVDYALQTYPDAKARYQRGLPTGQLFFLTTLFRHSDHHVEQVFVKVSVIKGDVVSGVIASDPMGPGFTPGQPYQFRESEILDWTIQHPDGTEEGNVVGKFLDRYQGECPH